MAIRNTDGRASKRIAKSRPGRRKPAGASSKPASNTEGRSAGARLRSKNQLTVPEVVVERLRLRAGDQLAFDIREGADEVTVRRLPRSYAGVLRSIYPTPEDARDHVAAERRAWDE